MKASYIIIAIVVIVLVLLFWKRNGKNNSKNLPPKSQIPLERRVITIERTEGLRDLLVNNDQNNQAATLAGIELQNLLGSAQPMNAPVSTGASEPSRQVAVRTATGFNIVQSLN